MKLIIKAGKTSQTTNIFVADSSSTTGAGLTGLAYNTAGLTAYYCRPQAAAAAITLATLAAANSSWSSGGFREIDATNMPGWYRFDIPNAVIAAGADSVAIHLKGATNMAPLPIEINLVAYDPQDTVRLGLTAMPNVASGSAGAIITAGTGTAQLSVTSGVASANVTQFGGSNGTFASGRPEVNMTHIAGTAWASTTLFTLASHDPGATLGTSTLTQAQVTGGAYALNSASFAFNAAMDFTTTQKAATLARVTLTDTVTTYTGNTPQTGDAFARIGVAGVGLTNLGDTRIANLDATVSSRSTLTQTQVTGGAYALNSALFAFNSALDFTTTQKAATLARVTLTDTVTTYTGNTPQTGDAFARIGLAGVGLTNLGDTRIANLDATVSSRSTLTQTQITGGAYALNSALFAFNSALDFTTTQKAATLARVTLTDTVTTYTGNTPQTGDAFARIGATGSGLTSLAPAATALSTATWTNTLATNLATTNTTVATNLDAAVSSRMATYTQPAGFLAATFPATVASPTNITAGTITTVTNLTNLPSIPLNWITAAGISAGALDGKGDWLLSSGYTAPPSAAAVASQVRTELSVELGRIDVATSTRLASTSYAAPLDAAGTRSAIGLGAANMDTQLNAIYTVAGLVQAKTDNLPATPASSADCITAAGVRTAIGMVAADLDTQLAAIYGAEQTLLANQIVMDTKLNNIKLDTAAILDDTGTTGVVISGGSGAALVASTAAQVTADHGSGSYVRNTEPSTAAQIWEYATRTLTSGSGGSGATAAEVWAYTDRTLTSGGGSGLTAAEVWAYAERTLTPLALDSIMAATGLEAGRYVDTDGNPVTQINLRQAIALLLAYSLGDRSGIGTRSIISKLAGETVQIEAERISQSVIEASGTVPV